MTYNQILEYIYSLSSFGKKPSLERIGAILCAMDNPQNKLKFVHIAGTNGKGSTTTMCANIIKNSGYKVGIFISPYILNFRERIQISGEMISEKELCECALYVKSILESLGDKIEPITQFEFITAVAFEFFYRSQCDIVCLEVGLGGRFDATNIINQPLVSVITSVSLDHTEVLGDCVSKIAYEKSGIIKGGHTVLYPIQDDSVFDVVKNKCEETGTKLIVPDLDSLVIHDSNWLNTVFSYKNMFVKKSLYGNFQIYNAITAIEVAKCLADIGYSISDDNIIFGIEHTQFPARMEVFSKKPLIILDGAHNPSGALALEETLKQLEDKNITILMGILKDKDYMQVLQAITPYADSFYCVKPNSPRAMDAKAFAEIVSDYTTNIVVFDSVQNALEVALQNVGYNDLINNEHNNNALIICGSLYLASEIRELIVKKIKI